MTDKVLINSLPKAGTNLLANVFDLLGYKESDSFGSFLVLSSSLRAKLNRVLLYPFLSKGVIIGVDTPVEIKQSYVIKKLKAVSTGEYVLMHSGYTDDLLLLGDSYKFKKILITRDPRAVLNSFIHFVNKDKRHYLSDYYSSLTYSEQLQKSLYGFCDGEYMLSSLVTRCHSLNNWIISNDVFHIKFEELIGLQGGGNSDVQYNVLMQLLNFIGYNENHQAAVRLLQSSLFGDRKKTFRKGKIDSWKSDIPEIFHSEVNKELAPVIMQWGYKV